ncbi:C-factor [Laetiporus sulphureus 93-53]|uniref:C-factor n=1 Tax=Laetiporus sulphureus 93-53 TaxID=1314785 RepID=A0A165EFW2_9APHY|nr:C-factor [Laetiporus sulphureus 93-53]KZT06974.1 C-factor [Laetiporus sulphureus 93-53]
MSDAYTWLITGTSRGIGLELVRQLIADPSNVVVATCRDPNNAPALQALQSEAKGELYIIPLDIADEASIRNSAKVVGEILGYRGLDYLWNNAAINEGDDSAFNFSYSGFLETLKANVAGPALMGQVYLPFLEQGKRKVIINTSSGLASIGIDFGAKNATYSVSKTALNMIAYKQAKARPDLISYVVDPGWVKTDMGGPDAMMEPEESVRGQLKLAKSASSANSGKFYRHNGEEIVW